MADAEFYDNLGRMPTRREVQQMVETIDRQRDSLRQYSDDLSKAFRILRALTKALGWSCDRREWFVSLDAAEHYDFGVLADYLREVTIAKEKQRDREANHGE